jgi:crotonobetainyl-CoA:carnitine CoA-transferase CaiB-like acyl-CoA transferase
MEADKILRMAIHNASRAASLAIGLDFKSPEAEEELKTLLRDIEVVLPKNTPHRVIISYGWLLLCTQMVNIN